MAIDYKTIMDERAERVDSLFRRAENLNYDITKELEQHTQKPITAEVKEAPAETVQVEAEALINDILPELSEQPQTSVESAKQAYEDIDIDEVLNNIGANIGLEM